MAGRWTDGRKEVWGSRFVDRSKKRVVMLGLEENGSYESGMGRRCGTDLNGRAKQGERRQVQRQSEDAESGLDLRPDADEHDRRMHGCAGGEAARRKAAETDATDTSRLQYYPNPGLDCTSLPQGARSKHAQTAARHRRRPQWPPSVLTYYFLPATHQFNPASLIGVPARPRRQCISSLCADCNLLSYSDPCPHSRPDSIIRRIVCIIFRCA